MMSRRTPRRGFTLVELIVSVGLFTIVVTIAMTAYLRLITIDKAARATSDVVTNLSFVVDSISRSARTGTAYNCADTSGNCWPDGGNKFSFTNDLGKIVTYILVPTSTGNAIGECYDIGASISCNASSATIITDPRINILSMMFYVHGVGSGDGTQPQVLFTVRGSITTDANTVPVVFTLESAATQRFIDL